jgi:hypothetical protein
MGRSAGAVGGRTRSGGVLGAGISGSYQLATDGPNSTVEALTILAVFHALDSPSPPIAGMPHRSPFAGGPAGSSGQSAGEPVSEDAPHHTISSRVSTSRSPRFGACGLAVPPGWSIPERRSPAASEYRGFERRRPLFG